MANPFPQDVVWNLLPSGPFQSLAAGPLQARVYQQKGHIELVGPNRAGAAQGTLIRIAPPAVQTRTGVLSIGATISTEAAAGGLTLRQTLGARTITARLTFPHDGVMRYEITDWGGADPVATALAIGSPHDEHVYGYGERFINFDQSGRTIRTLTFDEPGVKTDHAYKVAPWFISTRGYGFHLDSSAESTFAMRSTAPDRAIISNFFPTLAFQLVYGPALTEVLRRFTGYTGRPRLPPPFTFGAWISSDIWRSGGELRYAVTQFRRRRIPVSALVFDSPWEVAYNDFRFNMTQFGRDDTIDGEHFPGFASLTEMMQFLQTNGLKAICWMAPFVNTSSVNEHIPGQNLGRAGNYDFAAAKGFFVRESAGGAPLAVRWWKGNGSPIDFTNPAAREWLHGQLRQLLEAANVTTRSGVQETAIGGFKTDDGESGNGPNTYIPATAHYADGRTGREMRNAYCFEYQKVVWEVLGPKGILFARSGFTGSPAFPAHWAGDNEPNFGDNGLPGVIVAGQSAAMSGYAIWGHDTGGYQDTNFSISPPDLFMRWTQFGCFSPIMQMHRQVARNLQYPWRYGQEAEENFRFYARLHTQLFPYICTYARRAGTEGLPIIRPLVLLSPDDPNTSGVCHAYHFGDELLIAPIIRPNATTRQIYLPQGVWFDFWTHARHSGGQTITWTDPDRKHLPVFVREGALVPMLLTEVDTLCDPDYVNNPAIRSINNNIRLLVHPANTSKFQMFDDTEFECIVTGAAIRITVSGQARAMVIEIRTGTLASVRLNGLTLPRVADRPAFDAATTAWFAAAPSGSVLVKFDHPGGTSTINL